MRIVVDTNIVVSGVFFSGFPRKIIEAVIDDRFQMFASADIVAEYRLIVENFKSQMVGHYNDELFSKFINAANKIEPDQTVEICRDPDDDKFMECALSARAFYIVSGDKDLLVLERYRDVTIITAKKFCEYYL